MRYLCTDPVALRRLITKGITMRLNHRLIPAAAALALLAAVPACAPANTGTTYSAGALGGAAYVNYGTIVGTRPVTVAGSQSGVGTVGGAVAGGLAGSFIGGDWRSNAIAGVGGAILGGLAGTAIERGVTQGQAVEFIVRQDRGGDIAVVQTNEEGLQAGDRVVITRGDRVRLSRAAGGPVPPMTTQPMGQPATLTK
ncbi:outer membrane lipoprotein [Falsiroseomonas ponticola]|jgi:outer membrane lipoprotein SlyB|uniref:glycine zipper 2TM domain-containing protein n=1 Tax=Falsiroseomonas ponticola TaxID=2786951 RepID=UPI001CF76951|nr:glycine zipper 2TM domain-containing protein [Roseomonas ponticola]